MLEDFPGKLFISFLVSLGVFITLVLLTSLVMSIIGNPGLLIPTLGFIVIFVLTYYLVHKNW